MKEIIIKTELPYNYRKLKGFFISPGILRLFYDVKSIEVAGNLSYIINNKYNAILYFSNVDVVWEIYNKNSKLKDKISVFLYPLNDNTMLNLNFQTNRILPLKRTLESEVKAEVELLKSLLDALRRF
ncbi:hypothetical protein [Saccharolobus shibatae]|uniref:Hydrophobic ligand-binding domain protein n=2 Tax=Saccharolobus shibatae TaxID=2286 RepID=A0A8F5BRI8_SACSH|nr:hypothetical protein [Saccharolobus shibatae]QXJ27132.1 Hydrophobic ligand-binding domain protein [Saccharolobus shibatae B12]QXJ30025.1 Hydrophobic ligand-binding domain protein [Saccharolobus shibatae B12]QXJ30351.1 hypothetical protein J5U21_p0093 [Saccharolobus shibatae]QXJ30453.1 hypothetical protein J5U21_00093 [Saccharolobus shibatae]